MARLIYESPSGREEEIIIDEKHPVVTVGRSTDSDICANRKSVSRQHAEFRYLGSDGFELVDLNSSNGTYIVIQGERQKIEGREYLTDGDEIWCGDYIIHFFEDEEGTGVSIAPSSAPPVGMGALTGTHGRGASQSSQSAEQALALTQENEKLRQQLKDQSSESDGLRSQLSSLQETYKQLQTDHLTLLASRDELELEVDQLNRTKVAHSEEDVKEIANLQTQIETLNQRLETGATTETELRKELNERSEECNDLRKELEQFTAGGGGACVVGSHENAVEIEALTSQVTLLESRIKEQQELAQQAIEEQGKLQSLYDSLAKDQNQLQTEKREGIQNLAVAHAQVARLREDLTEQRNAYDLVSEKLDEVALQLQSMTSERDSLIAKLENTAPVERLVELQKEISGLNSRLRNEKNRRSEDLAEQEQQFKEQISSLQGQTKDLELQLKDQTLRNPLNRLPENTLINAQAASENLRLVVDAIARTDLSPLSTIDRVRLQGALHDLKAQSSLDTLTTLLSQLNTFHD